MKDGSGELSGNLKIWARIRPCLSQKCKSSCVENLQGHDIERKPQYISCFRCSSLFVGEVDLYALVYTSRSISFGLVVLMVPSRTVQRPNELQQRHRQIAWRDHSDASDSQRNSLPKKRIKRIFFNIIVYPSLLIEASRKQYIWNCRQFVCVLLARRMADGSKHISTGLSPILLLTQSE